ncbi:MAG: M28 family peptidase [Marinilabiliales bacterium]|nr:M28 family peptidase [Marinilabiliales bacterium]
MTTLVVPIGKSVVMLNLDMISRNGPDTLQLDGLAFNPDLASVLLKEAKLLNLTNYPGNEDLFKRSDHYNFFKKGFQRSILLQVFIPIYHTVLDNPDRADPAKSCPNLPDGLQNSLEVCR